MKILVTGATGYIGSRLTEIARSNSHCVISASHRKSDQLQESFFFDLNTPLPTQIPAGTNAVIHLAAHTAASSDDAAENEVLAAVALLDAAKAAGAKFVFVSSQSAKKDARTNYGRTKWCIEQKVLAYGGWVVRPGQVYGGIPQGLFGTLVDLVDRLPAIPAFFPPPLIQPIHVDDCASALLRLAERDDISSGIYSVASIEAISFADFLSIVARRWIRRRKLFVPIPAGAIKLLPVLLGKTLSTRLGLQRLNSLFDLQLMDTRADLALLNLELRSLYSGMNRSGDDERRKLIQEGKALLTYVLRDVPKSSLLCRYVRIIEKLRAGTQLDLPFWSTRWPTSIALLENRASSSPDGLELKWRLEAATVVAEASVQGALRFLGNAKTNQPFISLLRISLAVIIEALWRLANGIAAPLFRLHRALGKLNES